MDAVVVLFLVLRSTEYTISTHQLQTCDVMTMYSPFISACLARLSSTLYELTTLMGLLLHCC